MIFHVPDAQLAIADTLTFSNLLHQLVLLPQIMQLLQDQTEAFIRAVMENLPTTDQ